MIKNKIVSNTTVSSDTVSANKISFQVPTENIIELDGQLVSFGIVPNQVKAHITIGRLPDIVVLPEFHNNKIPLTTIYFFSSIYSAKNKKPLTVIVQDENMSKNLKIYMEENYRPHAIKNLDNLGSELLLDKSFLEKEYSYFDQFEKELDQMINIITIDKSPISITQKENQYTVGSKLFKSTELQAVNLTSIQNYSQLKNWHPRFGVITSGISSGSYGNAPTTNMIVRYKFQDESKSLWIDCGPQMKNFAVAGGESIQSVKVLITHGHEDHDAGLWELLLDDECRNIELISHPIYLDSLQRKIAALGLSDKLAKVSTLSITPRNENGEQNTLILDDLMITSEWAIHGLPTLSIKIENDYRNFIYSSDTATSSERLETLLSEGVIDSTRINQLRQFFKEPKCDLFIEEQGASLKDGVHVGDPNHNNSLDTISPDNARIYRVVHFGDSNIHEIAEEFRAKTMEAIELIP